MAPIPDAMVELQAAMGDESLLALAAALSEQLGIPIPVNLPPPSTSSHVSRPSQPLPGAMRSDAPPKTAPPAPIRAAAPATQEIAPAANNPGESVRSPAAQQPSTPAPQTAETPVEPVAAEGDLLYLEVTEESGGEAVVEYAETTGEDDIIEDFFGDAGSATHQPKRDS